MSFFTFLRPSAKSTIRKSESDENIPAYEDVLIEVERRMEEKEKNNS